MKKVRSNQASISINSCTELSKTLLFPVSIVKQSIKFYTFHFRILTILTRKNIRSESIHEFVKIEPWLLLIDLFDTFTQ